MIWIEFKTALRSLRRRPGFTLLNASGLTIGMTCCLLIGLFVLNEVSYDTHHPYAERTYRVVQSAEPGKASATIGDAVLGILNDEVPGVEKVARVRRVATDVAVPQESGEAKAFEEREFAYVSSNVLDVFAWSLKQGDPSTALAAPRRAVISESAARTYFGDADPMGRTLRLTSGQGRPVDVTVTGVMADLRPTSHLKVDVAVSFSTFYVRMGMSPDSRFTNFWWPLSYTYVVLEEGADVAASGRVLAERVDSRRSADQAETYDATLQPITDVHLHSSMLGDPPGSGSAPRVYAFALVALFVFVVACVNFVNLATALGAERTREVGVRKTIGAGRGQLIRQILCESLLISGAAGAVSVVLTSMLMPVFTRLVGIELAGGVVSNPWLWGGGALAVLVAGIGAGSYPAFALTRVSPAVVLGRRTPALGRGGGLRKGLVVTQFAISVALLVATVIAFQQMQYLRTAELGFDDETLVSVDARGQVTRFADAVEQVPGVRRVTIATNTPGVDDGRAYDVTVGGEPWKEGTPTINAQFVGFNYFNVLGLDLVAGRTMSADRPSDVGVWMPPGENNFGARYRDRAVVVNEAALRRFGWTPDEALGTSIRILTQEGGTIYNDVEGRVVGIVEDHHAAPLSQPIRPIVYYPIWMPSEDGQGTALYDVSTVLVEVEPGTPGRVMDALRDTWATVNPGEVFTASFVDERIESLYRDERSRWWMVGVLAGVAIFVACLGLFGLAAFSARQRTKEIGIRKALGASAASVVRLLSTDFLKLVGMAVVVAAPVAYLGMSEWLEGFAYRIDLGPLPLIIAATGALLVSALAVGSQALRAARIDPARTLRDD